MSIGRLDALNRAMQPSLAPVSSPAAGTSAGAPVSSWQGQDTFQRQVELSKKAEDQLNRIVQTAQQLGFTPEQVQGLQQRLIRGNYAIADVDARQSRNLLEVSVGTQEERERLLERGFKQLQEFPDVASLKVALSTLMSEGQLPDRTTQGTLVAYSVETAQSRTEQARNVTVTQEEFRINSSVNNDANAGIERLKRNKIQASFIDSLTPDFNYVLPKEWGYQGLTRDKQDESALRQAVNSPGFISGIQDVAKVVSTQGHVNPKALEAALVPLKEQIAQSYGLQNLKVIVDSSSPDGGASAALYDPEKRALVIFTSGVEGKFKQAQQHGLQGEKAALYVAKELAVTLAHEGRHAFQFAALENPAQFGLDKTDQDRQSLRALRTNTQVYVAPTVSQVLSGSRELYKRNALEDGVHLFEEAARQELTKRLGLPA
jgi:hypothetical protein